MDARIQSMVQQLLGRKATDEDRERITRLIGNLPSEVLASRAAIADIVLRADMLAQLDHAIDRITYEAQQHVHRDLPARVDQAAFKALAKLRDSLPIDSRDAVRRLVRMVAAWTLVVIVVAAIGGWIVHGSVDSRRSARNQAHDEQAFGRCIAAAEGSAASARSVGGAVRYDSVIYRDQARECAAEYADRRAGG